MSTDAMRPLGATRSRNARPRTKPAYQRRNTGSENLLLEGTVEGLVQLDERKLTVGASAKVTADIIAREVCLYGTGKGESTGEGPHRDQEDGSCEQET